MLWHTNIRRVDEHGLGRLLTQNPQSMSRLGVILKKITPAFQECRLATDPDVNFNLLKVN